MSKKTSAIPNGMIISSSNAFHAQICCNCLISVIYALLRSPLITIIRDLLTHFTLTIKVCVCDSLFAKASQRKQKRGGEISKDEKKTMAISSHYTSIDPKTAQVEKIPHKLCLRSM